MLQKHSIKTTFSIQKLLFLGWGAFAVTALGIAGFSSFLPKETSAVTQIQAEIKNTGYYLNLTASTGDITMDIDPSVTDKIASAQDSLNVKTNIPTGYNLYITATSTGETQNSLYNTYTPPAPRTTDSISAVTGTPASPSTFENHSNTWGYGVPSGTEGLVENQFDADYSNPTITGSHWAGVPTTIDDPIQIINHANDTLGGTNINFHYAVSANANKSSGTYTGTIVYTAIADIPQPGPTPPDTCSTRAPGIVYMQDVDDTVKGNMELEKQYFAVDQRDNKGYCIAKLKDGNIWMTQNLDLNLSGDTPLTSELSDVTSSWTPPTTYTATSQWTGSDDDSLESIDTGDYYYDGTTNNSQSGTTYAGMTGFLTPDNPSIDQHYHVGNLYSWNTATANSRLSSQGAGQATDSICPKGWRLPKGGSSGEFESLVNTYNVGSAVQIFLDGPIYMARGGYVNSGQLKGAANYGKYWSSTAEWTDRGNDFYLAGGFGINSSSSSYRYYGQAVRCVAR